MKHCGKRKQGHCMTVPILGCSQISKSLHDTDDNADDAKAIAVPQVF